MSENSTPTPPPSTPPAGNDYKKQALDRWQKFAKETKLAATRAVRCDFTRMEARPFEKEELESHSPPVTDPLAQNYSAWRRSVLLLAAGILTLHCILLMGAYKDAEELIREQSRPALEEMMQAQQVPQRDMYGNVTMVGQTMSQADIDKAINTQLDQSVKLYGEDNLAVFDIVNIILILSTVAGAVLIGMAAKRWTNVRRSAELTRYGFLAMFLTPIALNLIPLSSFLDFSHLKSSEFSALQTSIGMTAEQQIKFMETSFGTMLAISLLLYTAPKIIAIFAGAIRSAITIKTLIPESSTPGIAITTLGPLYAIFLVVAFGTANQFQNSFSLLGGTLCLLVVPIVYIIHSNAFLKPQNQESVTQPVANARRSALVFNLLGFSLIGVFILDLEFMSFDDLVQLITLFIGNVLVLSVAGSDYMLFSINRDSKQTRALTEDNLIDSLEEKIARFEDLGITELRRAKKTDTSG